MLPLLAESGRSESPLERPLTTHTGQSQIVDNRIVVTAHRLGEFDEC